MNPVKYQKLRVIVAFWVVASAFSYGQIKKVVLPPVVDLERADLYTLKLYDDSPAVLILCPGFNGNGEGLLRKREWLSFGLRHHLNLAAISFASNGELMQQGRGYYYASRGSGEALIKGLKMAFPSASRMLIFGFSGGAQFTARFVAWRPQGVIAWCAYSAGWWDRAKGGVDLPPGLLVCGDKDPRFGATLTYFKEGRRGGAPWLWITAGETGHTIVPRVEKFVRDYFAAFLTTHNQSESGAWVDIDLHNIASKEVIAEQPTLYGWLPRTDLLAEWRAVNCP